MRDKHFSCKKKITTVFRISNKDSLLVLKKPLTFKFIAISYNIFNMNNLFYFYYTHDVGIEYKYMHAIVYSHHILVYIIHVRDNSKYMQRERTLKLTFNAHFITKTASTGIIITVALFKDNYLFDTTKKVAFTAETSAARNIGSRSTIVFPVVINNEGGGYNPTRVFIAPRFGQYVFIVSAQGYGSEKTKHYCRKY